MSSRQYGSVIGLVTAIVGLVTSLTALWITIADRRRAIRRERREEAEAVRLARADEASELEREAERAMKKEMEQAAPMRLRLFRKPAPDSPWDASRETWHLKIDNRGFYPVTDVQLVYDPGSPAARFSESFDLQGGVERNLALELPSSERPPRLTALAVVFTDAAGRRWQRHLTGGLHLGTLKDDGSYEWDQPRFPGEPTEPAPSQPPTTYDLAPAPPPSWSSIRNTRGQLYQFLGRLRTAGGPARIPVLVLTAVSCLLYIALR
ncbi:hypothetical protein [Streptomyces bacillaris]